MPRSVRGTLSLLALYRDIFENSRASRSNTTLEHHARTFECFEHHRTPRTSLCWTDQQRASSGISMHGCFMMNRYIRNILRWMRVSHQTCRPILLSDEMIKNSRASRSNTTLEHHARTRHATLEHHARTPRSNTTLANNGRRHFQQHLLRCYTRLNRVMKCRCDVFSKRITKFSYICLNAGDVTTLRFSNRSTWFRHLALRHLSNKGQLDLVWFPNDVVADSYSSELDVSSMFRFLFEFFDGEK